MDSDTAQCTKWTNTTGWGGNQNRNKDNCRIRVSGNKDLDDAIVYEHELYKASGSIEAQARIDRYLMPCIVMAIFGSPYVGHINTRPGATRNKIPHYMWKEMIRPTEVQDVLQYHTLPDLGVYIRERMTSQAVFVPTCPSVSPSVTSGGSAEVSGAPPQLLKKTPQGKGKKHSQSSSLPASSGWSALDIGKSVLTNVLAFSHSCCPSSAPQARMDAHEDQQVRDSVSSVDIKHSVDMLPSIPMSCTTTGCLHGSIISLLLGSVMPLCKRASQCRRLQPTHTQLRSAVSCCTLTEYTIICSLVEALLLGLYPRGRKTAIFDVRVKISRRMRALVTSDYSMERRRTFLFSCIPVVQLAFVEYVYNVVQDFMPVESAALCIDSIISTSYATMCDQFRERCIHSGDESWSEIAAAANIQMDKLIRNMRMGPSQYSTDGSDPFDSSGNMVPLSAPSLPKKRRSATGYATSGVAATRGKDLMRMDSESVMVVDTYTHMAEYDSDAAGLSHATHNRSSRPYHHNAQTLSHPMSLSITSHSKGMYGGMQLHGLSSGVTTAPTVPLPNILFDMHVCTTDNLHLLYSPEQVGVTSKEMTQIHALHRRVHIVPLPHSVAREQQDALSAVYVDNSVRMGAARLLYVCTSCALAGKPVPLRPPMRYSFLKQRFTCLTCHRCQRSQGQQQRRDKGARCVRLQTHEHTHTHTHSLTKTQPSQACHV